MELAGQWTAPDGAITDEKVCKKRPFVSFDVPERDSKRRRTASFIVPNWAKDSGVPMRELRKFFDFMRRHNFVVARNQCLNCECLDLLASPQARPEAGCFCEGCCAFCPSCDELTRIEELKEDSLGRDVCSDCLEADAESPLPISEGEDCYDIREYMPKSPALEDVVAEINEHPGFKALPEGVRVDFMTLQIGMGGRVPERAETWTRSLWRHLNLGAPLPPGHVSFGTE